MSRIEKLAIRGIRSFDPQDEVKIEFFRPLTLIQGHNGSGKTLVSSNEVKASIKLKFTTPKEKEVLIVRNFQLSTKNKKYEFKRLEQLLKAHNSSGEIVTINANCADIDKQVPILMHTSKAILENVIFCHQEETNWPFSEPAYLKKVFDEIFDTAKYSKAIENLKDLNKEYNTKTKESKSKLELFQKDYEHYQKIVDSHKYTIDSMNDINSIVNKLKEEIQEEESNLNQILEYEENNRQKENEIYKIKLNIEEKMRVIQHIQSDPFFQDFTESEESFQNLIQNYDSNATDNITKINTIRTELNSIQEKNKNISNEIYGLHISINSTKDSLKKYLNNVVDLVRLTRIPDIDLKINVNCFFESENPMDINSMDIDNEVNDVENNNILNKIFENSNIIPFGLWDNLFVDSNNRAITNNFFQDKEIFNKNIHFEYFKELIFEKIKEIKNKFNEIDSRRKIFDNKLLEKTNECELKNMILENKNKEIQNLNNRLIEYRMNLINSETVQKSLDDYNNKKKFLEDHSTKTSLEIIEIDKNIEKISSEKTEFQEKISNLKIPQSLITDFEISNYNIKILERNIKDLIIKNSSIENIITEVNEKFNTKFYDLDQIINFSITKKEEILEQRTQIRELNFMLLKNIEQINGKILENKKLLSDNISKKESIFMDEELKMHLKKLNINYENLSDEQILSIVDYMGQLENIVKVLREEIILNSYEIKLHEKNNSKIYDDKVCGFCMTDFNAKGQNSDDKIIHQIIHQTESKISDMKSSLDDDEKKLQEKEDLLSSMKLINSKLKNIISTNEENKKIQKNIDDLVQDLNNLFAQQQQYSNTSKDRTNDLIYLEKFFSEDIYKLKNQQDVLLKSICTSLKELNFDFNLLDNNAAANSNKEYCEKVPYNNRDYFELLENRRTNININQFEETTNKMDIENNDKSLGEFEPKFSDYKNVKKYFNTTQDKIFEFINNFKQISEEYKNINEKLKTHESCINELTEKKSSNLKILSLKHSEITRIDVCISRLNKEGNSDISCKIQEIENEIKLKNQEKNDILIELSKTSESKEKIAEKKADFDKIYNEKTLKYETVINKLENIKIRIEYFTNSLPDPKFIRYFKKEILDCYSSLKNKEETRNLAESQISDKRNKLQKLEKDYENNSVMESIVKNNKRLRELKTQIKLLKDEVSDANIDESTTVKMIEVKKIINNKLTELNRNYNINLGKLQELNNYKLKLEHDMKNDIYNDIETRYNKCKMEYIASIETSKYIDICSDSIDQALISYHSMRMEEINKLINYYWSKTYKGSDIKKIEIRSDNEKTNSRSRSYNYRIIFATDENHELDMRGRCSAGQKILASIIIRLALAETFCNSCGILCLDEPTTNLDEGHIKTLAHSLREIIISKTDNSNFQLIVITHDPTFIDSIGSDFCDSFWRVSKNKRNFSNVELLPLNSIYHN